MSIKTSIHWNILVRGVNMTEDKYSEQKMKLRRETLAILLKNFDDNKSIYECADEWCSKQVTTSGLVKYYEAYYNNSK